MSENIYIQIGDKKRKATPEEIAQIEKDQAEALEAQRLVEAEQTKKNADRASAMAKLSALGLNEQEVAALIN
jgi:hypothetical protein